MMPRATERVELAVCSNDHCNCIAGLRATPARGELDVFGGETKSLSHAEAVATNRFTAALKCTMNEVEINKKPHEIGAD